MTRLVWPKAVSLRQSLRLREPVRKLPACATSNRATRFKKPRGFCFCDWTILSMWMLAPSSRNRAIGGASRMQATKKTVALIETAAGNVDAAYQRAILTRYAELQQFEVDTIYGQRAPSAGT